MVKHRLVRQLISLGITKPAVQPLACLPHAKNNELSAIRLSALSTWTRASVWCDTQWMEWMVLEIWSLFISRHWAQVCVCVCVCVCEQLLSTVVTNDAVTSRHESRDTGHVRRSTLRCYSSRTVFLLRCRNGVFAQ